MAIVTKEKLDHAYEMYREGRLSRRHFLKYLGLAGASLGLVGAPFGGAIRDAWKEIDAQIAVKEARKAELVPLVAPDLLALYEELRPGKEGVAVGRLAEGVCGGCHLRLSAAEQAEVLRESPPRCLHCRRILVPQ